jgi:rhodanese-related sulfurtransferase
VLRLFRGYKALAPSQVTALINQENALVVDLRAPNDFQEGHIAGSRNVQMSQFDPENKQLAPARTLPIVLVCQNGITVNGAAKRLKKAGFERVHILDGGITAWRQANLPLVKGKG